MDKKVLKEAEEVSEKIISLWQNDEIKNKSIIDVCNELIVDREMCYKVLVYIPSILAKKGYEIVDADDLELKKY